MPTSYFQRYWVGTPQPSFLVDKLQGSVSVPFHPVGSINENAWPFGAKYLQKGLNFGVLLSGLIFKSSASQSLFFSLVMLAGFGGTGIRVPRCKCSPQLLQPVEPITPIFVLSTTLSFVFTLIFERWA